MTHPLPEANLDAMTKRVTQGPLVAGIDYGREADPMLIMADIQLTSKPNEKTVEVNIDTQSQSKGRTDGRGTEAEIPADVLSEVMTDRDPFRGEEKANCKKGWPTPHENLCVDSLIVARRKLENDSREPSHAHGPMGLQIVNINQFDLVVEVG